MVLLEWADMESQIDRKASQLSKVAEFRSYVRPTWRPQLSAFCTALTGINQVRYNPSSLHHHYPGFHFHFTSRSPTPRRTSN